MSAKAILGIVFVAVAIAAPYVIPELIGVAAGSLAAVAVTAAVEVGIGLASSALLGPSVPKGLSTNPVGRLYATLDTTAPRKIVFGNTAGATDVRYQAYTGSNQEYYEQIVCIASHQVNSIYELWIDNEKAWTSAGGVQGRFVGYLTVDAIPLGTSVNGIAIDATWTTSCTLTGCAYLHLKFKLTGPDSTTPSPFQGGVSNRLTVRVKGALIYDPRLDSTVIGGSGSQRAGTQSTWAWDDNASRNPALQLLWYLLGWQINGKLAVGMGLPSARIDLASFITAANICDEAVALKAGGTEPRYRSDGVLSEGDDRRAVIDALCGTMNATLRDSGGSISVQILYNDLANVVANFDASTDVTGNEEWDQTQPLSEYFNVYRGRYVDASDNALYQLSSYPEVKFTSPDGIDRINTFDQAMVQSVTQAQRLAKLRLMRGKFQGKYTADFVAKAWATSLGKINTLTHAGMGWSGKLFRTAGQTLSRTGKVPMALIEEDSSIYAWSTTDEGTPITAGTPPVADPSKNPVVAPTTADIAELINTSSPVNPDPSTPIITASESQIFIKDHQRQYADKIVSVSGNTSGTVSDESGQPILDESGSSVLDESGSSAPITGLTAGTTYYIGYRDPNRLGGAVTYIVSTNVYAVLNTGAGGTYWDMHFLGSVTTTAAGSGTTTGGTLGGPPGIGGAVVLQ